MLKALLSAAGVYKIYEKWLQYQVKNGSKPEHIAIILDGNRRWAFEQSFSNPWMGHRFGASKVENLLDWCLDLNTKSITLYAFSTENFQRPSEEIEQIMEIALQQAQKARLTILGEMNRVLQFPSAAVRQYMTRASSNRSTAAPQHRRTPGRNRLS